MHLDSGSSQRTHFRACVRNTISPEEYAAYASLRQDIASGMAHPLHTDHELNAAVQPIMRDLLRHPLCRAIPKPELYIHVDPLAKFATFGNVIFLPSSQIDRDRLKDPKYLSSLKGVLAHELGHILYNDFRALAANPLLGNNTMMERRADLTAAHLCRDGGGGLRDWLAAKAADEKRFASLAQMRKRKTPEDDCSSALKKRYPTLEERLNYLEEWQSAANAGLALPRLDNRPGLSHRPVCVPTMY